MFGIRNIFRTGKHSKNVPKKERRDSASDFFDLPSREHKKVMKRVVNGATRRQIETLKKAAQLKDV